MKPQEVLNDLDLIENMIADGTHKAALALVRKLKSKLQATGPGRTARPGGKT